MRQGVGSLVGVIALTVLWVHNQTPPAAENTTSQLSSSAAKKGKSGLSATSDEPPEGPWVATRAFFPQKTENADASFPPERLTRPELPDGDAVRQFLGLPQSNSDEVWSVVATVADPLHTRLSLFLDNQLESIERSFQAAGWDFAGQWLPWMDHADPADTDIAVRRTQRHLQSQQENYPGILIFRSAPEPTSLRFPNRVLVVLLVPETPTTGISGSAFFAAMNIANAFRMASTSPHDIGLLAPSFTGSFSSLTQLLVEWESKKSGTVHKKVYGGTISGALYARAFENSTGHKFHSGIVDSEGYRCAFNEVREKYGISSDQAAFLRENATGYSRGFSAALDDGIWVYVFPRDISHLRNAYQDVNKAATRSDTEHTPGINFSLKDSENGEDSVPIFSTVQTPLSQNSIVDSITTQLRRRGTRIVFIAATNTLDALFLTERVRRNSPGTRVLVSNPDVLFVAAAYRQHLSGTLFLSSYPMFLEGAQWVDRDADPKDQIPKDYMKKDHVPKDHIRFPGPGFQGIFNVTQLLANDLGALFPPGRLNLYSYGRLRDDRGYPGLWLLTVTRSGFLPLDTMNASVDRGLLREVPVHRWKSLADEEPPSAWLLIALLTTAATLTWCILLLGCNQGWLDKPLCLVLTDQEWIRLMALSGACLSLSALEWVLGFPVWRALACDAGVDGKTRLAGLFVLAGFIAPLLSLVLLRLNLRNRKTNAKWQEGQAVFIGIVIALFAMVTAEWTFSCWSSSNAAFFFRFRALDLFSGASPAAPLAILGIGFFFSSLIYFKRYTEAGRTRPLLPFTIADRWPELFEPRRLSEAIEQSITAPGGLPGREWRIRLLICTCLASTCTVVLASGGRIDAIESWHYNAVIKAALAILLFCLATGCYDLVRVWRNLSIFIDRVDVLSLDSELDRVSKAWPTQPIWAMGRSLSRESLMQQMIEELHQREELCSEQQANHRDEICALLGTAPQQQYRQLASIGLATLKVSSSAIHLACCQQFEEDSARIGAAILDQDRELVWNTLERNRNKRLEKILAHGRGFMALELSRFLTYVVQQSRRIAMGVSLDLLLLILVFHSYNPQSPKVIVQFLAVLFAGLGAVVYRVFSGMERNRTLSKITHSTPGELGGSFWLHLVSLGGLPLLGLLAHLFPPLSDFLFSWVAPNLQAAP